MSDAYAYDAERFLVLSSQHSTDLMHAVPDQLSQVLCINVQRHPAVQGLAMRGPQLLASIGWIYWAQITLQCSRK